ncbi:PDC sensor domain-containing protein [Roseibacterium sp. SDUM158017]|nr:PDC sensor domain-containing protein [Roseibacterium sp. SDUM158017]MDG4648917.1 PDC sensor domain-containing protein [Roseibacterium sp. SDUM158017]
MYIFAVMAALAGTPAFADEFQPVLEAFLDAEIRSWSQSGEIVSAIRAQNAENANMNQDDILQLDGALRSEIGMAVTPTIDPVLGHAASDFLRARVGASNGRITEVFIMDAHGLNVASSGLTSDMWQGDEAKFTETFAAGAGAVHFSEVQLDESTQRYQAQISVTIVDPDTGEPIGAMTVGVDAEALL